MPIFLGFSSQKGGVGKSTLAEIVSSILYYEEGLNLFVVDCDLSQDSFYKLRQREKNAIENSPDMSRQLQTYFFSLGRIAYRILKADPENAVACANDQIRKNTNGRYDLVSLTFPDMQAPANYCNIA
jgi:cellulose biosynthesis protein BcsQ